MKRLNGILGVGFLMALGGLLVAACTLFAPGREQASYPNRQDQLHAAPAVSALRQVHVQESYGRLPLSFERNAGQTAEQVEFLARGQGYTLFLSGAQATLALQHPTQHSRASVPQDKTHTRTPEASSATYDVLTMQLLGVNPTPIVEGQEQLPGRVNYFIGNDPDQWRTEIPTYAKVHYHDVYPGIDLVYYGNPGQLEYDLIIAPGADPASIRLTFAGATQLKKTPAGALVVQTAGGQVQLSRPLVYQEQASGKHSIPSEYILLPTENPAQPQVGFQVAVYDQDKPLIIDPALVYSTFLGSTGGEFGRAIVVDGVGQAYVTGQTTSSDFPTVLPFQATFSGGDQDAFVTKLNAAGTALLYSTYLGGGSLDHGISIDIDVTGNAYVTGRTNSLDFPTQTPFQATFGGGFGDAFVTKLNATGTELVYSTYLGGSDLDDGIANGIFVDAAGSAYVTGSTDSTDFPTATPFQATIGGSFDAFVTKLSATGTELVYSTYLGGSGGDRGFGIVVDAAGYAYVSGLTSSSDFPIVAPFQATVGGSFDAFVTQLNPTGTELIYSTYLGGSGDDRSFGLALDAMGNAYITGLTSSSDFPTAMAFQAIYGGGSEDAFVTQLNAAGTGLVYSTYLGGSGADRGNAITLDPTGSAYVTGLTTSADFPTVAPIQATHGSFADAFVTRLTPTGTALSYSTYLDGTVGGNGLGIAVDAAGNAYVTGRTNSPDFPTATPLQAVYGGGADDVFVTKIAADITLSVSPLALEFGAVLLGSAAERSITLQNTGATVLTGTVDLATRPFNVITGGGDFSLAAGASQTLSLRFTPTSVGSFGGIIDITSTGGSASLSLSGDGTPPPQPALSACSTSLTFSQVALGQSVDLSCLITNAGTETLTGSANTDLPFSLVSGESFNLATGQSQSIVVRFTPENIGDVEADLRLSSDGGNTTIILNGTGVQGPILSVSPERLNFGSVRVGQSRDLPLTVQNIGGGTLTRTVCVPEGFRIVSGETFSLSSGQSQPVTVRFSPLRATTFNSTATFTPTPCSPNPQPDTAVAVISGVGRTVDAFGTVYVVNRDSNTVSVVNTVTQVVEDTISVGMQPIALALTPDARKVYVANFASNTVSVIDTATRQVTSTIAVGLNPIEIVVSPDGQRAYVANAGAGEDSVSILDVAGDQLVSTEKIFRPDPSVLTFSPNGTVLYVLGSGSTLVGLLNTATNERARIRTGEDPVAVAFHPDGHSAYVVNQGANTVSVLDTTTFPPSELCDVAVEEAPVSVIVGPDGEKVYVANFLDNSLSVFNPCVPIQAPPSAADTSDSVRSPKETLLAERLVIPDWLGPSNIQFDPNTPSQVLIVNEVSNNIGLLDITTDQAKATIPVGMVPKQSAFDTQLPQAVVTNSGSNSVALVDTASGKTTTAFIPVGETPVALIFSYWSTPTVPLIPPRVLENPQPDSFQSGIGVISGFVCEAIQITIEFDGTASFDAAYGTSRGDTQSLCGDANNGFSLLFNWNLLGNGTHTVRALADGVEFAQVTITVTTLGLGEFVTGLERELSVLGFPGTGDTTSLRWQQSQQNFVIFSGAGGGGGSTGDAQRVLENPSAGSFQSGVGVISGFVCDASQILIEFNGTTMFEAAYGTSRGDTIGVCGDANNGFSLLFNWNLLGNGMHTVRAFSDGVAFADATITVTTLGEEFRTGLTGTFTVSNFPLAGQTTSLRWQQSLQNFVIDGVF